MHCPPRLSAKALTASRAACLALLPALAAGVPQAALAQKTSVAIGDSLAYGYMDAAATPVGTAGYPGYAQPYAAFLSSPGKTVSLVNLGIVGETTGSLRNNAAGNSFLNSNYSAAAPTSQYDRLLTALTPNVSNVTVQIGGNDILGLAANPVFQQAFETSLVTGDQSTVQSLLGATLASVGTNYDALLTRIGTLAPGANVQAVGYYNPYAFLPPSSPASPNNDYLGAVSVLLEGGLNNVIAQEAALHHVQFVDLAAPFAAHGGEYNKYVLTDEQIVSGSYSVPNDHPTALGYALIAQQLEAAAAPVPEASTALSFGLLAALGLGGLIVAARRRKARA